MKAAKHMSGENRSRNSAQVGRDAAVKRLKAYSSTKHDSEIENLAQSVVDETDRGAVILLTTAIEDVLTQRLKREMISLSSDESSRIFGSDSPLGTFSSKIKMAHALGYISRETMRICDLIREMRNACAHSGRDISFANEELSDVMRVAYGFLSKEVLYKPNYKGLPYLGKVHYIWMTAHLMIVIKSGSREKGIIAINELMAGLLDDLANQEEAERRGPSPQTRP